MTIKLSETQHAAIIEISETGRSAAKSNTLKSLEAKELIKPVTWIEDMPHLDYKLTDAGRKYMGLPAVEENFHEKLMEDVAELESGLQDEPLADWERELLDGAPEVSTKPQNNDENPFLYFDEAWNNATRVEAGFGETLKWKHTEVWDGLTAEEIREDMDTRVPANRADKRAHDKAYRKAVKQLVAAL